MGANKMQKLERKIERLELKLKNKLERKPRLIAFTTIEGGDWHKWSPESFSIMRIHSLLFQDGSIWDFVNGWRPRSSWYTQLRIRQVRNEWKKKAQA
jgi:hypothetical protein